MRMGFTMRTSLLALVILAMSASVVLGQEWAEKVFIKDGVPHLTHDFGVYALALKCIMLSPSPTTTPYRLEFSVFTERAARTRAPNARNCFRANRLLLTYTSAHIRFTGRRTALIKVMFGPPYNSIAMLRVDANCREAVECSPKHVRIGTVPCGEAERKRSVLIMLAN